MFDCTNKGLTRLPNEVQLGTDWVILTGNNLGQISMVTWLSNVTHIDLSFSNVTAISNDVMSKLVKNNKKYLSIARNNLKYVPREIEGAGNGTELWIGGNPYECNCDMLWMRDWLVSTTAVRDRDDAVCNTGNMKGRCSMNNVPVRLNYRDIN